jgi:hypothetical protein
MARITKAMLEGKIRYLERLSVEKDREIEMLKYKINCITNSTMHQTTMIIALEKTTEAVAHVLSDLKRRTP